MSGSCVGERGRGAASPFHVTSVDGRVLDSKELNDKPVLVVFFASWCPVCARELPAIRAALQRGGDDVVGIGVSLDDEDTWPDAEPFVKRTAPGLTLVRGEMNPSIVAAFDPNRSFPVVVVMDGRGRIVLTGAGVRGRDDLASVIASARACSSAT